MKTSLCTLLIILITSFSATLTAQTDTIPVVFHILHQGGAENIGDSQVIDALRILNEDFNLANTDISDVFLPFRGLEGNARIVFRLAALDPQGNPTTGIDRIYTSFSSPPVIDSFYLNQWDPASYLNIWTVKQGPLNPPHPISPAAADTMPERDGIVVLHDYVGSTGTGFLGVSRTLTHQVGHFLNLLHPWGDTDNPGVACGDDSVNDTPETKGWISCHGAMYDDGMGGFSAVPENELDSIYAVNPSYAIDTLFKTSIKCNAHIVENVQNFMEYSYCSRMFTPGQVVRMKDCLSSNVGNRGNLRSASNLQNTGVVSGITAPGINALQVVPNPFNATVRISGLQSGNYTITVCDITGREVIATNNTYATGNYLNIDLSTVTTKGIYVLKLTGSNGQSSTVKLVRE